MTLGRSIVIPVANPASVDALLACAAAIADADGGQLVPVTVVSPTATADDLAAAWRGVADAEEVAHRQGVTARGAVVRAEDPATGVLQAVRDVDASLVVMGWRGGSSTHNIFGSLIDSVVGRSSVPLAVLRLGASRYERVLLPVSADHLLPGGDRGLALAAELARRLAEGAKAPTTVLRTGPREVELPAAVATLGDRIHHDPRRTDQAVGAAARPEDLVVAAVAPTVSGLRAATTHLAWAAPDATLLVAVDVGPTREEGLADAVEQAGEPAPRRGGGRQRPVRIVVTARLPDDGQQTPDDLDRVLRGAGTTNHLMAWWPAQDTRPHVRATVTVQADSVNAALSRVMVAVHDAPAFQGAEITYDVDRGAPPSPEAVTVEDAEVAVTREDDSAERESQGDSASRAASPGASGAVSR